MYVINASEIMRIILQDVFDKHFTFSKVHCDIVLGEWVEIWVPKIVPELRAKIMHINKVYGISSPGSSIPDEPNGMMVPAKLEHLQLLKNWQHGFNKDAILPPQSDEKVEEDLKKDIEYERRFLYLNSVGIPVSMVGFRNVTSDIKAIRMVYTPPEHRRKNYSTLLLQFFLAKLFSEGVTKCCLFADSKNPVSQRLYQKIGFSYAGDVILWEIVSAKIEETPTNISDEVSLADSS